MGGWLVRRSLGHFESKICVFTAWLKEAQLRKIFFFSQKGVCRECYASLMRMSVRLEIAPFRNGRQQLTGVGSTLYTWEAVFTMFAVWKGLAVGRIQHRIWIFAWLFRWICVLLPEMIRCLTFDICSFCSQVEQESQMGRLRACKLDLNWWLPTTTVILFSKL